MVETDFFIWIIRFCRCRAFFLRFVGGLSEVLLRGMLGKRDNFLVSNNVAHWNNYSGAISEKDVAVYLEKAITSIRFSISFNVNLFASLLATGLASLRKYDAIEGLVLGT